MTAKEAVVYKNKGEDATLQWNVININSKELFIADLFLCRSPITMLYRLGGNKQPIAQVTSKKLFGKRMTAVIQNGATYILKLENVKYNDTNSFTLELGIRSGARVFFKEATIKLHVKGMLAILFS